MSAVLVLVGLLAIAAVLVSLTWQWISWRKLGDQERADQQAIKHADAALHQAERAHKKAVRGASRDVSKAAQSPQRGKFGKLTLHDDHIATGGATYPLSAKTKARVRGQGRGDKRKVMVLLEDTSWPRSLSAEQIGKSHELAAEQFAAETRVLAAQAAATRTSRAEAVQHAQVALDQAQADTDEVEVARAARAALGERHRGAGPAPGQQWRRVAAPAGLVALILGGALAPTDDSTVAENTSVPTPLLASTPPAASPSRAALRQRAREAVGRGDYSYALRVVQPLDATDQRYVERLAVNRAAAVAERAIRRRDRSSAHKALLAVNDLPRTKALALAERHYESANAAAGRARAQRRAAARRAAARHRAERRTLLAEQESAPSNDSTSYAGMTCPEIGHSFDVTPGSDPDHDADNDGVACESQ